MASELFALPDEIAAGAAARAELTAWVDSELRGSTASVAVVSGGVAVGSVVAGAVVVGAVVVVAGVVGAATAAAAAVVVTMGAAVVVVVGIVLVVVVVVVVVVVLVVVGAAVVGVATSEPARVAAERNAMKRCVVVSRPPSLTTPTPTWVKLGSTMFAKWLGDATNASMMPSTATPVPTFSPIVAHLWVIPELISLEWQM